MKKGSQDTKLFDSEDVIKNNLSTKKIKTTDVNILLNRVKLDEKIYLKKKLIFLTLLVSIIITFVIFALN
tara:strand:- start:88 stop:297 length:210 start_codon:yes stop_codon:yes gene_type:complete